MSGRLSCKHWECEIYLGFVESVGGASVGGSMEVAVENLVVRYSAF